VVADLITTVTSNLGLEDITSTPVVDDLPVTFVDVLSADEITAGVPVVDTVSETIISNFVADEITIAAPTVDTISVDIQNFRALPSDITAGIPTVDAPIFVQIHNFAATDVFAGTPTNVARFTWDFQEIEAETWTDVSDITDTWTLVRKVA
jgi:hypothetical protein